jgi:hypothetical protein
MARKCGKPVAMVEGRTSLVDLNYTFNEFCSELTIVIYVLRGI